MDETTPLVSTLSAPVRRRRDVGLGFVLGICFVASLIGSFCVGRATQRTHQTAGPSVAENDDEPIKMHTSYSNHAHNKGPRYIATQFISFTINTLGGNAEMGECQGKPVDNQTGLCYLGNTGNLTKDVQHRLSIVKSVLAKIKQNAFAESPDIDYANDVLKIVMLPEFFWRGPNGAYSTDQALDEKDGILTHIDDSFRDTITDDFFSDFLFCFGTLVAARSPTSDDEPWEHAPLLNATEIEYFNLATVVKGGPHAHYYIVTKKYISGADFLSRTTLPNPKLEGMHDYAKVDDEFRGPLSRLNATIVTDNVIELDGLRIGLEICLDHRVGELWNTLRTKNQKLVDILLITSAGMAIERGPNPIVPGGVVYLSDGEASSAACIRTDNGRFYPDHVCRGNIGGLKHVPVGGPGYSSFFGLSACWDLEDMDLLQGYYSLYLKQGCAFTLKTYDIDVYDEFKYYPPSVEIYPTVDLPKSTYED